MKYKNIAIFCGSAEGNNPIYAQQAREFGLRMAEKGLTLYYGGGCIGLMWAAAEAVMQQGGTVIGVAPDFFTRNHVLAENITKMIYVKTMSERKQLLEYEADAFVALPGGYGTMDELFEILTDSQLGMHSKPIVLFNQNGFYDHLVAQLDRFSEEGFLRPFHKNLLLVANTLDELFECLDSYENTNDPNWLKHIRH